MVSSVHGEMRVRMRVRMNVMMVSIKMEVW